MKWLKGIGIFILVLVVGIFALIKIMDQPLPEGKNPAEADELAQKMLTAINQEAWQNTGVVEWTFHGSGVHSFVWDKKRHLKRKRWSQE